MKWKKVSLLEEFALSQMVLSYPSVCRRVLHSFPPKKTVKPGLEIKQSTIGSGFGGAGRIVALLVLARPNHLIRNSPVVQAAPNSKMPFETKSLGQRTFQWGTNES